MKKQHKKVVRISVSDLKDRPHGWYELLAASTTAGVALAALQKSWKNEDYKYHWGQNRFYFALRELPYVLHQEFHKTFTYSNDREAYFLTKELRMDIGGGFRIPSTAAPVVDPFPA